MRVDSSRLANVDSNSIICRLGFWIERIKAMTPCGGRLLKLNADEVTVEGEFTRFSFEFNVFFEILQGSGCNSIR